MKESIKKGMKWVMHEWLNIIKKLINVAAYKENQIFYHEYETQINI